MNERKLFDAIYFVPLKRMGATSDSDVNQLAEIFGRCMEGELRNREGNDEGQPSCQKTLGVHNIDDLIRVVKSMNGARRDTRKRILFVIDSCDAFVPESFSMNAVSDAIAEVAHPLKSFAQHQEAVEATAVSHPIPRPMGLIALLDGLFRRTQNVKCLLTASTKMLGDHDVLLVNEAEKVITLKSLSDKQSAELMVKLAPRGLKLSEMNSSNLMTAVDTLAARPVLKDLGGHPRAIAIFCSVLADKELNDLEPMRRFAQDALQRAKAWTEIHHGTPFAGATSSQHVSRRIDKQGHFPIPVAVAVANNTPGTSGTPCLPMALPHRVTRSTSENNSGVSRPHILQSCNSSGTLFSMTSHSKSGQNTPRVSGHQMVTSPAPRYPLPRDQTGQESTPQKLNIKNVDPVVLEESLRAAREVIRDRVCADVWAKVSALAAGGVGVVGRSSNGGAVAPVFPTSVRWSSLISALSESLEAETKVSRQVETDIIRSNGRGGSSSEMETEQIRTVSLSRRLTKDDARFLFHRMQLDRSWAVNSGRGHVDYVVDRSRYVVFCEWWAPLIHSLTILNAEFSCKTPILIHGFLNRQKTEETLLSANEVGVFLLRFSESHAGYLVVSFTDVDSVGAMKVHHCLVNVGEDGVSIYFERGECKYLSLQELVMNCSNLLILYPNIRKEDAFDEILPFMLNK